MRSLIHKFLLLCGAALVCLRFVPTKPGDWLSKLFFDDMIHDRFDAWGAKLILGLGVSGDAYQTQIAGLESLAHVMALIAQALLIALLVYIITRWV